MATHNDLFEQIKTMITAASDVRDSWTKAQQEDSKLDNALTNNYPPYLPSFDDFVTDLAVWLDGAKKSMEPRVYVCSCDNEVLVMNGQYPTNEVCLNCGHTEYWIAEDELEAEEEV